MLARRERNLTQDELAKKIDISRSTIINWEADRFDPDEFNLKILSEVLNKPISYFYEGQQPSNQENELPPGAYSLTDGNTIRLYIFSKLHEGEPVDAEREGYIDLPRHLVPGAAFVYRCEQSNVASIPKGAHCIIRKETIPLDNKIMLIKTPAGYTIKKITSKLPAEQKVFGEVLGIVSVF